MTEGVPATLDSILEELLFHRKLLTFIVESIDSKQVENSQLRKDIQKQMDELANTMGSNPMADVLKGLTKTMGGKHGD